MTRPSIHIQIAPTSVPSTPSWLGEVAILAHVLSHCGLQKAIEERVQFARARMGDYEVIDFVVMLMGYAVSGEPTLKAFYERLLPFAEPFMALFGRAKLPHRGTLSRFLAALDETPVEALRTLFQEDLVARAAFGCPSGGIWDRQGTHWTVVDVDATKQAARQRALPQTPDLPAPHRRCDLVAAPAYLGRKRGEVARTRTTVLQAHTHQWLGTFGNAGNGDYRGELRRARAAIEKYASSLVLPLSHVLTRLDGLYGNAAPLADLLTENGPGVIVRGKDYHLLDLPQVQTRLQRPADQQVSHPESGTRRALFDCPDIALTPAGPVVRMIVASHPATCIAPSIGVVRHGSVYEQFFTTVPQGAFTPADVLDLYLHRGSFETMLADEDLEQDPDRWASHTPCGQEFWQILSQWIWNLRLDLGQHVSATSMRLTELSYSQIEASVPGDGSVPGGEPAPGDGSVPGGEPAPSDEPVRYGPPQWACRSYTKGFAGADFALQPDGTLLCPADHPLYPQERRRERNGSLRVLYAARIGLCRGCSLRSQCQENDTTIKPRRVSAVFWPLASAPFAPNELTPDEPSSDLPASEMSQYLICQHPMSQYHLAQSCGEIGSAVKSGDDGSICCARKRLCSPLAPLSTWCHKLSHNQTCKPEPSGPIGGSVGSNVLLAMLARLLLLHSRSLSMVCQSPLPSPLALMWSRLHKRCLLLFFESILAGGLPFKCSWAVEQGPQSKALRRSKHDQ